MNNGSSVKIYINPSKPYYYPGENFVASILLDVLEKTNCDKMQIIAKGKAIINAVQKTYIDSYFDSDSEAESNSNESDNEKKNKLRKSKRKDDSSSSEEVQNDENSVDREINESHKIFKYIKIIELSKNNYIKQGKYSFPFEVEIPENIPSSFLFMEQNAHVEILYTVKVKLNKIKIKEAIPIIIRQKEKLFNYPRSNDYTKSIMGCCFDNNEVHIKLSTINKYMLNNKEITLNIIVNNTKCYIDGSPIKIELYQKLILYPKNKTKRIKITKLVGNISTKRHIKARQSLNKDISFLMEKSQYAEDHLKKTKSIKYFRHKNYISFLNQSIKSKYVNCEYEAYAEVQFPNWSVEEIGVFLPVLIYPPEKGDLSKTIASIAEQFLNSIINKKVFLTNTTKEDDPEFRNKNSKAYKKNINYDNSDSEEEYINKKNDKRFSLMKVKGFGIKEKKINESNDENEDNQNKNNIDNNNLNNNDKKDNNENDENKIINDDGSFGNYEKGKKTVYIDTNSNNIKKDFSQTYLNDALDDEFLDKDSQ